MYQALRAAAILVASLWIMFLVSLVFPSLLGLGIQPRTVPGLIGIAASPFLHLNLAHLVANSISLFILSLIFFSLEKSHSAYLLIAIVIFSGFSTWLLGRPNTCHIGASGVIYGLLGYLLAAGIFQRRLIAILVSVLVFILYGGAVWGILPKWGQSFISWEGHLFGFIWGIVFAWAGAKRKKS